MLTMQQIGLRAKAAKRVINTAGSGVKNKALKNIAQSLLEQAGYIIEENKKDLKNGEDAGLGKAMLERLMLNPDRIKGMASGIDEIIAMTDPVGKVLGGNTLLNGLRVEKISVPLGVVGIIYESRPNVTADAAALCIKSGNAVILRGGKEAIYSNKAIAGVMRDAMEKAGLPADCIQLVEDTSRDTSKEMMRASGYIDVLIPRGSAGLIKAVVENSTVPVIETGSGNCHIYIDSSADIDMAAEIVFNAKTTRPSVCNACESLLIHKDIAERALPAIKNALDKKDVEIYGDGAACAVLNGIYPADEADYAAEYLDYKISVKTVSDIDEAIMHISKYSTGHSEAIVTSDYSASQKFLKEVDSSAVYVNASTRFTDGGVFGMGAEIGISTQKLHARGPMGLGELTSYKYVIYGEGQVR